MRVEVLGTGCPKCTLLAERVSAAAKDASLEVEVVKVMDIQQILGYGVLSTPALVVEGKVQFSGKVPEQAELVRLLLTAQGEAGA